MKKIIFVFSAILAAFLAVFIHPAAAGAMIAMGPIASRAGLTIEDLEHFAQSNLSSFDGAGESFEGFENYEEMAYDAAPFEGETFDGYDGYNDDFVDFGGPNKSFMNAGDSGRIFVMTIANTATVALTAYLVPGYNYYYGHALAGVVKDGAFYGLDGGSNNTAGLSGSGSPKLITDFFSFLTHNPIHVGGIKIEGSLASQVSQQLIIELVISNQTRVSLAIPAGCTTVITWLAGGIMNPSHALQQKVTKAKQTAVRRAAPARPAVRRPAIGRR